MIVRVHAITPVGEFNGLKKELTNEEYDKLLSVVGEISKAEHLTIDFEDGKAILPHNLLQQSVILLEYFDSKLETPLSQNDDT